MKTRDEQIEEAAQGIANEKSCPIIRSMYPMRSRGQMADEFKEVAIAMAQWLDANPAPTGKVLSERIQLFEAFFNAEKEYGLGEALRWFRSRYEFEKQKPVGER